MNPSDIPPFIAAMTFMILGAGIILLRPLTRRLGDLLEVMVTDRRRASLAPPDLRVHETLSRIEERLRMLEERQDFTDSLLARSAARPGLPTGSQPGPVTQPREMPADTQG